MVSVVSMIWRCPIPVPDGSPNPDLAADLGIGHCECRMNPRVRLQALNHIGVRVRELQRSVDWYAHLGFRLVWHSEQHKVACLRNDHIGVELNFIVNADDASGGRNVLMDLEQKYPGFNHLSFRVPSIRDTISALGDAGIEIREGPVSLGGEIAVFVRDPDLNVVELAELTSGR
jgi:lactoylglutathione lyase